MKTIPRSTSFLTRLAVLTGLTLAVAGCSSVRQGPVNDTGGGSYVPRGTEPEPSEIPQKDVPEGQSSLRHTQPGE